MHRMSVKHNNFSQLIENVYQTHSVLLTNTERIINQNLTIRNWLIGCHIVEYEQYGADRAEYGSRLLDEIAIKLKAKGLKGLRRRELQACRLFYSIYPQIWRTVSAKFQNNNLQGVELPESTSDEIRRTVSAEFKTSESYDLAPELLLSKLSYSHFLELIRVNDPLQRLFYEVEAIKNSWSVRELARAIDTSLALRTTLSINKETVIAKIKNLKPENNVDVIRSPLILDFLGLQEKSEYSETDLEQAVLNHLQQFLMELGTGFCFEARQKRITFDNTHYRIDLVFYHRILKCHVLIDLKIGRYTHADAGQMTLYLNYYEAEEMSEGDNPPIGIILCADKDEALVKYTTAKMTDKMFVSKYLLELPDRRLLEDIIKKDLKSVVVR
jgi:predicted nuclease of restriction endonuclease-like (RecB) superfamily